MTTRVVQSTNGMKNSCTPPRTYNGIRTLVVSHRNGFLPVVLVFLSAPPGVSLFLREELVGASAARSITWQQKIIIFKRRFVIFKEESSFHTEESSFSKNRTISGSWICQSKWNV